MPRWSDASQCSLPAALSPSALFRSTYGQSFASILCMSCGLRLARRSAPPPKKRLLTLRRHSLRRHLLRRHSLRRHSIVLLCYPDLPSTVAAAQSLQSAGDYPVHRAVRGTIVLTLLCAMCVPLSGRLAPMNNSGAVVVIAPRARARRKNEARGLHLECTRTGKGTRVPKMILTLTSDRDGWITSARERS